jgi:hypothetical protein
MVDAVLSEVILEVRRGSPLYVFAGVIVEKGLNGSYYIEKGGWVSNGFLRFLGSLWTTPEH